MAAIESADILNLLLAKKYNIKIVLEIRTISKKLRGKYL